MNDTEIKLLTLLSSYGDIVELDWKFDTDAVIKELQQSSWIEGTHGKRAINLTGPIEDIGLEAKDKHDADQPINTNCTPGILPFFNKWEKLARCRAVELSAGSYFKMHRDAHKMRPQMRVFIPLNKVDVHEWNFIYNTERVLFKPGVPYILNTRKQHGSFAFEGGIYHVLMSIYITEHNVKTVMNMLPNCKEY